MWEKNDGFERASSLNDPAALMGSLALVDSESFRAAINLRGNADKLDLNKLEFVGLPDPKKSATSGDDTANTAYEIQRPSASKTIITDANLNTRRLEHNENGGVYKADFFDKSGKEIGAIGGGQFEFRNENKDHIREALKSDLDRAAGHRLTNEEKDQLSSVKDKVDSRKQPPFSDQEQTVLKKICEGSPELLKRILESASIEQTTWDKWPLRSAKVDGDGNIKMIIDPPGQSVQELTIRLDGSWIRHGLDNKLLAAKDAIGNTLECKWDSDGNMSEISMVNNKGETLTLKHPDLGTRIQDRALSKERLFTLPFLLLAPVRGWNDAKVVFNPPKDEYNPSVNGQPKASTFIVGAAASLSAGPAGVSIGGALPMIEKVKAYAYQDGTFSVVYPSGILKVIGMDNSNRITMHPDGTQTIDTVDSSGNVDSSVSPVRLNKSGIDTRKANSLRVQ